MTLVVVPIRYPLTVQSRATLTTAQAVADRHDGVLSVLHVDGSTAGRRVPHDTLKHAAETALGPLPNARYVSRSALLVKETIVEEVRAQAADIVVVGTQQVGHVRRVLKRVLGHADIGRSLRNRLECEIVMASAGPTTPGTSAD
jgi:nucleotide-binding universal stress UspA family protein